MIYLYKFLLLQGLLVDSNPDWSLNATKGVLVVKGPNIVCRKEIFELGEVGIHATLLSLAA